MKYARSLASAFVLAFLWVVSLGIQPVYADNLDFGSTRGVARIGGLILVALAVIAGRTLHNLSKKRDPSDRPPEWQGDAEGRRRRLLIIVVVGAALLGSGLFALTLTQ